MPKTTFDLLGELVDAIDYRPGWDASLVTNEEGVTTLEIVSLGYDTHHPERGEHYRVMHPFIVPPATYNEQSWTRWLLDRYIDVETHEACEFFRIRGKQPFPPNHGPGWAQYGVREVNRVEDAEVTWRGERREGSQS
jgi:hypothetical protein